MIDYDSKSYEFQQKYKFDNARMMANHMIDNGIDVMATFGHGYYWSVMVGKNTFSVLKDGSFEELTQLYMELV